MRRCFFILVVIFTLGKMATATAEPLRAKDKTPPPQGFNQEGPCVAAMGVHYVRKTEWPLGPILGYDDRGNLIFLEYMIAQDDFQKGISWENLPGITGKTVNHVDVSFMPEGHPGLEKPHYDIHMYFISHEAESRLCPSGFKPKFGSPAVKYAPPR